MQGRIGFERQSSAVAAFDVDEQLLVLRAQALQQVGVHDDFDLVDAVDVLAHDGVERALQFDGHGHGVLDQTAPFAIRAGVELRHAHALGGTLTGHFHQSELRDGQDVGARLVALEPLTHELVDGLLVLARFHVDKVGDNEAADVPQAHLTRDFVGRLEIGLQDRLLHILAAFVAAGVDVDRNERFGFVDDDVAAAGEPDLAVEGFFDLLVDAVFVENVLLFLVKLDALLRARGDLGHQRLHAFDRMQIIADHRIHFLGEEIADGALDKIGLLEKLVGRALRVHFLLNLIPLLEEQMKIADEETRALSGADRADDDPHAVGNFQFVENFPQAFPFLRVVDLAGDAALRAVGHEDEIASGHADVRRDARAFGADGAFADLHHDIRAGGIDGGDILGGDGFGELLLVVAAHFLDAAVEGGRDGVPEMKEGVFLEADVDEHGLEALLDVFHAAFEDRADDVALADTLDIVFLQLTFLEDGHARFQFLDAEDEAGAAGFGGDAQ